MRLPLLVVALGAVLLWVAMLMALPREMALIRALDQQMLLHDLCRAGDAEACGQRRLAGDALRARVLAASEKFGGGSACLFAGDEGVALRCDDVVFDVTGCVDSSP